MLNLEKMKALILSMNRKKLLLAAAAVVVVIGYLIFGGVRKATGNYLTEKVKKGTITSTISASGMVEPVSAVSLSFKNSEVIKKIYVKLGDHVTKGQLLAEQDSSNLEAQVNQSAASLKSAAVKLELLKNGPGQLETEQDQSNAGTARASFDLAKTNLERYQKLYQAGAVSSAELENAQKEYNSAEAEIVATAAQVETSRAQLQMVQNDLSDSKMVSPIDGIVSAVNGAEGQRATANNNNTSGNSGFMVVISEELQVRAQVNEADIGRVESGQKVEFTVNSFPDRTFSGKVGNISPQAYTVSNVQIYDVIIQPDQNYRELKAGMPSNVSIITDRHEGSLVIPKGAVTYAVSYMNKTKQAASSRQGAAQGREGQEKDGDRGQQAVVLVLGMTGNPQPCRVVLGLSDLTRFEVISGLNEGDTVVIGDLNQPAASGVQGGQGAGQSIMPRVTGTGVRR